jgi:hypothetical protein
MRCGLLSAVQLGDDGPEGGAGLLVDSLGPLDTMLGAEPLDLVGEVVPVLQGGARRWTHLGLSEHAQAAGFALQLLATLVRIDEQCSCR